MCLSTFFFSGCVRMDGFSDHCHHKHFSKFGRVGWNSCSPTWFDTIFYLFQLLLLQWMGIGMHTNTITTTHISPDLGEFPEILGQQSVQAIPLCYRWDCISFQTASHVHLIHISCVWAPSSAVDEHIDSHSHQHHKHFPQIWESFLKSWVTISMCANNNTVLWLRL